MEWKDVLAELVTFIKTSSPEMWRILVKQVYVAIAQSGIGIVVSSIAAFVLYKVTKKTDDMDSFDRSLVLTFSWVGFFIAVIACIVFLSTVISMLINPEFYAIKLLLSMN